MRHTHIALFGSILAAITVAAIAPAHPPRQSASGQPLVAQGERVFEASCSNQYCHGSGGKGAQGPGLVDVPMTPDHVRAVIRQGRAGTPMAPFKEVLEPPQLEAVIAYVLSISSGGKITQFPTGGAASAGAPPELPPPSTTPVAVGREKGTPAVGAELFFDANRLSSCRTCHSYSKRGGPLGLDFVDARKTSAQVLASLSRPRTPARAYPVITVVTASGAKHSGIRSRETDETLQLFDVSVPPVRRSFAKTDIAEIVISKRGIFDHTRLGYSRQQLLDLAALLGTSQPN